MGSRRRPSQRFHVEEVSRAQTPEDPNELQLLPTVKKGTGSHGIEDCLGHQKWFMKRQPALHPALTDFGPQSLQAFVEHEHARLRDRAMRAVINARQDQDQQLRQFALDLVNAQSNIYLAKENGQRTFRVCKTKGNTRRSQEHNASSDKGKAPIRNVQQGDGASTPGSWTQANDVAMLPAPGYAKKSMSNLLSHGHSGPRGVSDSSKSKPPGSKAICINGYERPAQSASSKTNTVQPLRRSTRTPASKKTVLDQAASTKDDSSVDVEMLDEAETGQDSNATPALEQVNAEAPEPVTKPNVLLTRTTSFENHASSSRISLRSRGKSLTSGSQLLGDSHRRRKTPAITNFDDPIEPTPGWPSLVLPEQSGSLEASVDSFFDPIIGSRIENDTGLPPSQLQSLTQAQPHGERKFARRYSLPRNVSRAENQPYPIIAKSECEEMENRPTAVEDVNPEELEEQFAIWESTTGNRSLRRRFQAARSSAQPIHFDYGQIVPETMPSDVRQAEINRCKIWQAHGFDGRGKLVFPQEDSQHLGPFTSAQLDPEQKNFLSAPNSLGDYPRKFVRPPSPGNQREPPFCPPTRPKTSLPIEFWEAGVLQYLSSAEVRSLRLVCRSLSQDLEPYVFRSVVAKFDPFLFSLNPSFSQEGRLDMNPDDSMLKRHGPTMNKFGITFDFDSYGLMHAPFKNTEKTVDAWFGRYKWPIADYPYFPALKNIDKLLDDERRLLTQAMSNLGKCSELAISVDSGHGWLEGPDTSDFALYRNQIEGGVKIFGKTFSAIDRRFEDGMKQLFAWAQINTINESIKYLDGNSSKVKEELETLRRMIIRDYDSYRDGRAQPDYTRYLHTGGVATTNNDAQIPNPTAGNVTHPLVQQINQLTQQMGAAPPPQNPNNHYLQQRFASVMDLVRNHLPSSDAQNKSAEQQREGIQPQWPIIFNGFNLSAESRGDTTYIQSRVATPSEFPLLPNALTEAQAQWIMETSWIQRTFLSAYTDAVRVNSSVLRNVHSLHIAKLSSGLLPALSSTLR